MIFEHIHTLTHTVCGVHVGFSRGPPARVPPLECVYIGTEGNILCKVSSRSETAARFAAGKAYISSASAILGPLESVPGGEGFAKEKPIPDCMMMTV